MKSEQPGSLSCWKISLNVQVILISELDYIFEKSLLTGPITCGWRDSSVWNSKCISVKFIFIMFLSHETGQSVTDDSCQVSLV